MANLEPCEQNGREGGREGFLEVSRLFASWEDMSEHLLLCISIPHGDSMRSQAA